MPVFQALDCDCDWQEINRVIEAFAKAFFKYSPGPLLSSDAAYVLAYSVIMLNTVSIIRLL